MDNIKNDNYYKNLILNDLNKIVDYSKGIAYEEFINDEQLIDAVLFRMIQVTENIKKLSVSFKEKYSQISWNDIVGFRNRIVHDYGKTDYSIVYEVVSTDIPTLIKIFK